MHNTGTQPSRTESKQQLKVIFGLALSLTALVTTNEAFACATCGCSLSTDAAMGYSSNSGFRVSLQYDYINQNQLRSGTGPISQAQVATIPGQEVENKTTNNYITLGLSYAPNADWNYQLLIPYIDRRHSTYSADPALPLSANQLSNASVNSLGDIKFLTSYQGFLPTHNLGVQLGIKLPTGNYGGPNAAGTGVVGRNPVYFGAAGNAGGQILDTSLQAGTGSTDLIVGAYYYQPVSQNFDVFANGQFQSAIKEKLDQPGADYRPGNLTTVSFGTRYEANPNIVPQLQVNFSHHNADQGALADTTDTAGTVAYLSPGISASVTKNMQVYGFVQVPIYSQLSGYQLFPRWTATVGMGYSF
ncbi:MAG: hypothetical protein PF483_09965 [Halothiobacillus sp.]|jgi:hypothetical protein|nr:hypothetical protein [Halothiobacillus sp.]